MKAQHAALSGHILLQNDGIDTFGQCRTGQHADRLPRWHGSGAVARRRAARHQRHLVQPLAPSSGKAIAIDRRIGQRRIGADGGHIFGQDASPGIGGGPRLGLCHRVKPRAQQVQRLIHRGPMHARRQGETVVAQGRRRARGGGRRGGDQPHVAQDEIGNGGGVVQIENGPIHLKRHIAGQRPHRRIIRRDQWVSGLGPMGFDLRMAVAFVAFDQHQIDRREPRQMRLQRRLIGPAQLMHQSETRARGQKHLPRTRDAVAVAVFAGVVHVKRVMRVLDG